MNEPRMTFTHDHILLMHLMNKNITLSSMKRLLTHLYYYRGSTNTFKYFETKRKALRELEINCKPTISHQLFLDILEEFGHQPLMDLDKFVLSWKKKFGSTILNAYVESQCNRLQIEHVYQMVSYLRGLQKMEFINDAKNSRMSLSKSSLQLTGYSTHKFSFVMPEITYKHNLIIYQKDCVVHNNLRTFCSQILPYETVREIAIYRIIKRKFAKVH